MRAEMREIVNLKIRLGELVDTKDFNVVQYLGDPLNAVKVLSSFDYAELSLFDISGRYGRVNGIDVQLINRLAKWCPIPMSYAGNIASVDDAISIIRCGIEKIALGQTWINHPQLISDISRAIGSQSTSVILNVISRSEAQCHWAVATLQHGLIREHIPLTFDLIQSLVTLGAGELYINHVSRDGSREGLDRHLCDFLAKSSPVPVIIQGGALETCVSYVQSKAEYAGLSVALSSTASLYGRSRACLPHCTKALKRAKSTEDRMSHNLFSN